MSLRFKKLLASIFSLILPAFLFTLIGTKAYAENSYIIVHSLNPEGVEIASIQGMNELLLDGIVQNDVKIYDGDTLISYGAYNAQTHNKPISISSGDHTIKVKFNGIIKEQAITLNPNETKIITFTFERTEFNLREWLDSFAVDKKETISGSRSFTHDNLLGVDDRRWYDLPSLDPYNREGAFYVWLSVWPRGYAWNEPDSSGNLIWDVSVYAKFNSHDFSIGYNLDVDYLGNAQVELNGEAYASITMWEDQPIHAPFAQKTTLFKYWVIQSIRNFYYPTISVAGLFGTTYRRYWLFGPGSKDLPLQPYQLSTVNANIDYVYFRRVAHTPSAPKPGGRTVTEFHAHYSENKSGTLDEAKMSSVPYDILGTGIKDETVEPPAEPTLEILDGADFSAGGEVSSEPAEIAIGGTSVEGAVTDGVTRLLLRLSVDKFGPVTFTVQGTGDPKEDGVLRSINNNLQKDNTVTVNTVEVNQKQYAFVIYQAPENFVRKSVDNDYNGKPDDETASERTISIKVECNNTPPIEKQIKLVRPPLILVHGLRSNKEMWDKPNTTDDFKGKLEGDFSGTNIIAESYPSSVSFEENKDVIPSYIAKAKKAMRERKIAMVQSDILGHSMGGVLARIYAGNKEINFYLRDNNFQQGDIHKFITLDSPHKGGFLADFALQFIKDAAAGKFNDKDSGIFKLAAFILLLLDNGALSDLATTSNEITLMNKIDIKPYFHAIAGDFILDSFIADDGEKGYIFPDNVLGILHAVLMALGYNTAPYITTENSDLVVSLDSQKGGASGSNLSVYNHHHIAATTETVLNRVIGLLNVDLVDSNDFSRSISK